MTRVLVVVYYWPPSGGPGVQRGVKLCRHLIAEGIEPVVVTVTPETYARPGEYPQDPTLAADIPAGLRVIRTPPGGEAGAVDRWIARLRLVRAAQRIAPGRNFERQAAWPATLVPALRRAVEELRPDAILSSSQPYSAHLAARAVRRETGVPWIADFRDPWTQAWGRTWASEAAFRWEEEREAEVLEAADCIVWNTPGATRDLLARRRWLDARKVVTIPNGYDPEDFPAGTAGTGTRAAREPADSAPSTDFVIVHSGAFRGKPPAAARTGLRAIADRGAFAPIPYDLTTHSPETLFRAVAALGGHAAGRRIRVRLAGHVDAGWLAVARDLGVERSIESRGYLAHRAAVAEVLGADLLYLPTITRTDGAPVANVPAKTYEYLGSGRPIVALAGPGDVADLLAGRDRAAIVAPRDVEGLAATITECAAGRALPALAPDPADAHPWRRTEIARRMAGVVRAAIAGGVARDGARKPESDADSTLPSDTR